MHEATAGASRRVAVIGGGISGLAVAGMLARLGHEVTVLEQQDDVGGRAGRWSAAGFRFDTGPSWYLMPDVFDHWFALMGSSAAAELDLERLDPGYRVYFRDGGPPADVPAGRERAMALFEAYEPGAGARLGRYLDSAADAYRMALAHFLYTSYASFRPLLNREVLAGLPRLARLLTESLQRRAARTVTDRRLRQLLGYPAVFLASAPDRTPSLYHLLSHLDLQDGVFYPRGGFAALIDAVERLSRQAGARIRTGATVTEITTEPTGGRRRHRVTGVRYRTADGVEHRLAADAVISAADLHHTETTLLPRALQTLPEPSWRRRLPGPGAILLLLGVRGELPQLAHHTLVFTEDWDANFAAIFGRDRHVPDPASMYVSRTSATDPTAAPPGHENLFVLVPVPADPGIGRGGIDGAGDPDLEAAADRVIAQLATDLDVPDLAERIVVRRVIGPGDFAADLNAWSGTSLGPAHTLRQSAFLRGPVVSSRVAGLSYCGSSTQPGVGLPMCLISAENLVKRLHGDVSTVPLREPLGPGSFRVRRR
ncbi:phytoene dehydrogenase [Tersicoccus phoenicis]|uniref:Phytoene dehydrogenase n=1 Tax=Tersicoccus phoenicis TaxID=554083 RepID=A0A1R1LD59_9MICC|nr:phytoene dehydrogenase [Tersicoccus phoenicis]